jgi:phospholipid/cholesterol/gamma-HCH transport system substrate-binding protein
METKANYVLIGAFVLLAAAAVMLFTLWIAGTPLNRDYSDYDVVFEGPVNGLTEGGEVRFNGIKVGEVTRLNLDRTDPNKVIARIRVDAQTPVRTDSVAQLNFLGITGVTFIQILAGNPDSPMLVSQDFQPPPVIHTSRTLVDELFQGGQDLLGVSGDTIKKINEMLSEENLAHMSATLAAIDKAATKIASDDGLVDSATIALKSINTAAVSLDSAARAVDTAANSIGGDVSRLSAEATETLGQLEPVIADARVAMQDVNGAVAQINRNLAPAATAALEQIGHTAIDVQSTIARLQSLLSQIEQDPSRFVYQQPQPVER